MHPPWSLSSSQVRSERPLFSSNPELDNLVRSLPSSQCSFLRRGLLSPLHSPGVGYGSRQEVIRPTFSNNGNYCHFTMSTA